MRTRRVHDHLSRRLPRGTGSGRIGSTFRRRVQQVQRRTAPRREHAAARAQVVRRFRSYWPPIADDDSADPVEREISRRNNAIEKIVVSDTLRPEETAPWTETTRILPGLPRFRKSPS